MATAVAKMSPSITRLSLVSRPMRAGGMSSIAAVSAPSGDRCLRREPRTGVMRAPRAGAGEGGGSFVNPLEGLARLGVPFDAELVGAAEVGHDARAWRWHGRLAACGLVQGERAAIAAQVGEVPIDRVQRARAYPAVARTYERNALAER